MGGLLACGSLAWTQKDFFFPFSVAGTTMGKPGGPGGSSHTFWNSQRASKACKLPPNEACSLSGGKNWIT